MKKTFSTRLVLLGALVLLLAACTPQTQRGPSTDPQVYASAAATEAERTALMIFHRMRLGFLETGSYTTYSLVDLTLPQGVLWTLEDFTDSSFTIMVSSSAVPEIAWSVSEHGVRRISVGGSQSGSDKG